MSSENLASIRHTRLYQQKTKVKRRLNLWTKLTLLTIHPVDHHGRNYDRHVEGNDRYLKSSKKGRNGHYLRYPEFSGRWQWYLEYVIQKFNLISEVYYIPDTTFALTTVCQIEKHTLSYWKLLILAIASSADSSWSSGRYLFVSSFVNQWILSHWITTWSAIWTWNTMKASSFSRRNVPWGGIDHKESYVCKWWGSTSKQRDLTRLLYLNLV